MGESFAHALAPQYDEAPSPRSGIAKPGDSFLGTTPFGRKIASLTGPNPGRFLALVEHAGLLKRVQSFLLGNLAKKRFSTLGSQLKLVPRNPTTAFLGNMILQM